MLFSPDDVGTRFLNQLETVQDDVLPRDCVAICFSHSRVLGHQAALYLLALAQQAGPSRHNNAGCI